MITSPVTRQMLDFVTQCDLEVGCLNQQYEGEGVGDYTHQRSCFICDVGSMFQKKLLLCVPWVKNFENQIMTANEDLLEIIHQVELLHLFLVKNMSGYS